MRIRPSAALGCLAALAGALVLSGCAQTVSLDPAADAANPKCAGITVRLPKSVANQPIRRTDAQATGAWGSPATILLRCGVTVPGPTTLPCVTANGIDWIVDESKAPKSVTYTTFGRNPATQVIVDHSKVSSDSAVLADLATAVGVIAQTDKCVNIADVHGPSPTPAPSPTATPGG